MRALFRISLAMLLLAAGCAQSERAKGDPLQVEKRTLPQAQESYRLERAGPGAVRLLRVKLCPVQERKIYEEVRIERQPAASVVTGVTCGIIKFFEVSNFIYGREVVKRSDCSGAGFTDRHATGARIEGKWETRLWEVCGAPEPLRGGGKARITFLRSGDWREYAPGPDGVIRFERDDLRKLRLYLTLLREVELEVRYGGVQWRQKIDLE